MLTFLSRSIRRVLDAALRRAPAPALRALPQAPVITTDFRLAARPQLHLRAANDDRDIEIAVPAVQLGASAFVAGQGARIYSLDVFRRKPRHDPRAA
jgi:hypothetical protein